MSKNKYYNPENMRAVLSVVIRAVLGLITATLVLIWLTGTIPDIRALFPYWSGAGGSLLLLVVMAAVIAVAVLLFMSVLMLISGSRTKKDDENKENRRAPFKVIILVTLGIIAAAILLMFLMGTSLSSLEWLLLLPLVAFLYAPAQSAAAILFTAAAMFIFLRKQIEALPFYKPLILNACLGAGLIVILATPLIFILYPFILVAYISEVMAVIVAFLGLNLCIIIANRILYKSSANLPEEDRYSLSVTIMLCVANSLVYFMFSLGIPVILLLYILT